MEKVGNSSGTPLAPPAAARERKREISRGQPLYPAKGLLPLGTPLQLTPMGDNPHRHQLKGNALPQGVPGEPCRGLGCPQIPFSFLAPPAAAREKKGDFQGETLVPRQGATAPWNPA